MKVWARDKYDRMVKMEMAPVKAAPALGTPRLYRAGIDVPFNAGISREALFLKVEESLIELLESCRQEILHGEEAP